MTDSDRTRHLWLLFRQARDLDPSDLDGWIANQCRGDSSLAEELRSLLAGSPADDFLESGPVAQGTTGDESDPLPGAALGHYRIEQRIGAGGMGAVYRAREIGALEREVAVKVVRRGLDTEQLLARFRAEQATLARLSHPAVVPVHHAGITPDGRPWFAMELVAGKTINEHCAGLGLEARLALFLALCDAVQHIHQKGLVHRDLKPSNILVRDEDDAVKLIDFGISRALAPDAGALRTVHGQPLGTPEYMSPEQCADSADVDTRSDIYALGVVLYELLTGERPFGQLHGQALTDAKQHSRPVAPSRVLTRSQRPGRGWHRRLKGDFDWIVLKAMESERERRYQSAAALADDIQRALANRPIEARPPSRAYLTARFVRRHPVAVSASGIAVLILVAMSGALAWRGEQLQRALATAVTERERAEQVSTFMTEVFSAADPHRNSGAQMTARELLDQGRARLAASDLRPRVRAQLLLTMANTYRRLGLFDSALESARSALEASGEPVERDEHELLAEILTSLATLTRDRAEFKNSAAYAERALALRSELYGPESVQAANSLGALGYALLKAGEPARAEPLLERAVAIHQQVNETADEIAPFDQLASLYVQQGRFDEAETLYLQSVERSRRRFGEIHPETATRINNLAALYYRTGRLAESAAHYESALAIQRQLLDPLHPSLLTVMNNLGALHNRLGHHEQALDVLREALAGRRQALGEDHLEVAVTSYHLANALHGLERDTKAGRIYADAVRIMQAAAGPDDRRVGVLLNGLARFHLDSGNWSLAHETASDALRVNLAGWPERHRTPAISRLITARASLELQQPALAAQFARSAFDVLDSAAGAESQAALAAATLALALDQLGQSGSVQALRDQALAGLAGDPRHRSLVGRLEAIGSDQVSH